MAPYFNFFQSPIKLFRFSSNFDFSLRFVRNTGLTYNEGSFVGHKFVLLNTNCRSMLYKGVDADDDG